MFSRSAVVVAAMFVSATCAVQAQVSTVAFNVDAQPLVDAINLFGRQAGMTVMANLELTEGRQASAVKGRYTPSEGFALLLKGTGLQAEIDGPVATIRRAPSRAQAREQQMDTVIVTGQRDEVYATPASVARVTREQIDRMPPRNTGDILAEVAGVYSASSRADPGLSVNIRGMQDFGRVNVMIDGTRQNYQASGHGSNGQVYIDPELLSGVDVAKGPVSTVGGAAMIGGVVNFHTLDVDDIVDKGRTSGARVNASTGSNAYHFAGSTAAGLRASDDLDLVFAIARKNVGNYDYGSRGVDKLKQSDTLQGYTQLAGQDQWSGLAKATWRPTAQQEFKFSYIGLDTHFSSSTSGLLSHNDVRSDTLQVNHVYTPDSGSGRTTSSLYYTRTRNKSFQEASASYGSFDLQYETNTVGGTLQSELPFDTALTSGMVKFGGEFFHDWTDPKAQTDGTGSSRWFTGPTPEGKRTVASAFSEATVSPLSWLELTGGLRYDWYSLSGDGEIYTGSIVNPIGVRPSTTDYYTNFIVDRHAGSLAPKFTLAVNPSDALQLFATVGQGLRPPGLTETLMGGTHIGNSMAYYPNPGLEEEKVRNWEVGANMVFDRLLTSQDKLKLKAAWFNNKVRNYITLAQIVKPTDTTRTGGTYSYVNLDEPFRSKGLELQLDYDAEWAFGSLAYTHLMSDPGQGGYDPFPLGSVTGYPTAGAAIGAAGQGFLWYMLPPRKSLVVSGGVRLMERKLELGARLRVQSPSRSNGYLFSIGDGLNGNGRLMTSQTVDLWAAYKPTQALTLRLSVENVADKAYTEMNDGNYWLAPGRTFIASMSYRF